MTCYVPDYAQDNRGKCGAHKGGSGVCVKVCNSFSPTLQRLRRNWLLEGQVGGHGAFENLIDVYRGAPVRLPSVSPI